MANDYTFVHMLKDIFFNGNKVSGNKNDDNEESREFSSGPSSNGSSPSSRSRDFDPSDTAGVAFRSVFGDDNS